MVTDKQPLKFIKYAVFIYEVGLDFAVCECVTLNRQKRSYKVPNDFERNQVPVTYLLKFARLRGRRCGMS